MKIIEKEYNNQTYYYIDNYKFPFGIIHKFANDEKVIFCIYENNNFEVITNKRLLRKIMKSFETLKMKDIV